MARLATILSFGDHAQAQLPHPQQQTPPPAPEEEEEEEERDANPSSLAPLLPWISPLFLIPLLCLFFIRSSSSKRETQGAATNNGPPVPGPPKQLPVLGNLLQLGSRPHRYFLAVAREYGTVVQVQLGRVRMVVVTSPEAAKEVLRTNDLQCCSRPNSPGGIDTCAVTTIWIMSELMRNPRVMRKAQAEVRAVVRNNNDNNSRVNEEGVQRLKYLKMIVKENFRLHPPGTLLIPRETMQSCEIAGYSVDAGTRIHVNVWAMGRDPAIWDRPEEFCPERFEDSQVDFRGLHFELLPFGSGRRACPAVAMGVANVELVLANLLYCFDWELPDGVKEGDIDMEETGQLVFRKKVALLLVPVKRQ